MHCLAVKKTLLEEYPDLPEHLFELFAKAKKFSLDEFFTYGKENDHKMVISTL